MGSNLKETRGNKREGLKVKMGRSWRGQVTNLYHYLPGVGLCQPGITSNKVISNVGLCVYIYLCV